MLITLLVVALLSGTTFGAPFSSSLKLVCKANVCEIEGELDLPPDALIEEDILPEMVQSRNALINPVKLWKGGIVPYVYHRNFTETSRLRIESAMRQIESKTCVKFVPWDESKGKFYVTVLPNEGCFASIGFSKTKQAYLNLSQRGCLGMQGTMQHELLHILGLEHEQSRPDRDQYVEILSENVKDGMMKNFKLITSKDFSTLDVPYDFDSVMHYSAYSFTKNRKPTVVPKDPTIDIESLGQRRGAADSDIKKINILYKCNM